ncbi:MAG: proline dehydrogenase family protein [Actinomycetota bacterium]
MTTLSASVIRPLILRLAEHPWFRRFATDTRPGRAVASRFVAGETLDQAMTVGRELDRKRVAAMLDHLGENVETAAHAADARDAYLAALEAIRSNPTLDIAVSLKLTQLGLDRSVDECLANVEPILAAADEATTLVMIDMEAHAYVERTLGVVRAVHAEHPRVGVALQSYLRRSAADVFDLPAGIRVRLVKGSYLEPPDVVFAEKQDVDESFRRLFATLLARGHAIDVATHDPRILEGVRTIVDATEAGWSRVEFQMLYGVRRDLQADLARRGYPVRVYIPYGTEWYPYLTRRLAERPANMWFFASNLVRGAR